MYNISIILEHKGHGFCVIASSAPLCDAAARMEETGIDQLLVADETRIVGVLRAQDVLFRVIGAHRDPESVLVADVMTDRIETICAEASIEDALEAMSSSGSDHLLVCRGQDVLGLVAFAELIAWIIRDRDEQIRDLLGYITRG